MTKSLLSLSFLLASVSSVFAQKVTGDLQFEQHQTWLIHTDVKHTLSQQANDQRIDFDVDGSADHYFRVTNVSEGNVTLRHSVSRFRFSFDGMGARREFDSDSKKDMEATFGKPVREMLEKKYDMVIDREGRALSCKPDKIELPASNDQLSFITGMLSDLTSIFYPPAKGTASFFQVLPKQEVGVGDTWSDSISNETEKSVTDYTLVAINDTTILVDYKTQATLVIKSEMRGMQVTSNLKSVATGKITLDKVSKLVRLKTSEIDAEGTAEIMGTSTPVKSKTILAITVAPGSAAAPAKKKG